MQRKIIFVLLALMVIGLVGCSLDSGLEAQDSRIMKPQDMDVNFKLSSYTWARSTTTAYFYFTKKDLAGLGSKITASGDQLNLTIYSNYIKATIANSSFRGNNRITYLNIKFWSKKDNGTYAEVAYDQLRIVVC